MFFFISCKFYFGSKILIFALYHSYCVQECYQTLRVVKLFSSFYFLAIKLFLVKDFRNNEFIIVLLTGLPLVVAFFLDQWLHCGVPLWILYSLFCVQAGDSWSSQYLLVFRLHLHHCVSFLLVDR